MECLLGRHGPGGGNQTPSFFLGAAASALLQQSGQATPAAASLLSRAMRRLGDTNAGWAVALGLNTAVVGILGWQLAKQAHGAWLSWRNAGAAVDRLFQLATQVCVAGLCLQPDATACGLVQLAPAPPPLTRRCSPPRRRRHVRRALTLRATCRPRWASLTSTGCLRMPAPTAPCTCARTATPGRSASAAGSGAATGSTGCRRAT